MKQFKNSMKVIFSLLLIIAAIIFFKESEKSMFSVIVHDYQTGTDIIQNSKGTIGTDIIQSFVFNPDLSNGYLLMSSFPIDDIRDKVTLNALIEDNFLGEDSEVIKTEVFKNKILYSSSDKVINIYGSTIYTSPDISLIGDLARLNEIKLLFTIKSTSGVIDTQEYVFQYFFVNSCESNDDCSGDASICDIGNNAGFSTTKYSYYCAKPCISHLDCYDDQLCRNRICGY